MLGWIRRRSLLFWALVAGLLLFSVPTFQFLAFHVNSDFHHHAGFIAGFIERGVPPLDFLYYGTVALLSGLSTDMAKLLQVTVIVMTCALLARFLVTTVCLGRWLGIDPLEEPRAFDRLGLLSIGLLLSFCPPLPGMHWYLGQFPPNVWHNSTTIAVMPFAVLLFFHSAEFLEHGRSRALLPTSVYTVLGLLTKPSLFFPFAVVFPIYALLRLGPGRRFLQSCIPVALGGLLLLAYAALMFFTPLYETGAGGWQPRLALGWLDVWRLHSSNVPLSVLDSLLLPLLFFGGYPRLFLGDLKIRYASAMLLFGLLLFAVVQETGDWAISGNLSWQNIISNYLLHCAIVAAFVRVKLVERRWRPYDYLLVVAFSAGAALGVLYVVKIFLTRDYY